MHRKNTPKDDTENKTKDENNNSTFSSVMAYLMAMKRIKDKNKKDDMLDSSIVPPKDIQKMMIKPIIKEEREKLNSRIEDFRDSKETLSNRSFGQIEQNRSFCRKLMQLMVDHFYLNYDDIESRYKDKRNNKSAFDEFSIIINEKIPKISLSELTEIREIKDSKGQQKYKEYLLITDALFFSKDGKMYGNQSRVEYFEKFKKNS